MAAKIFDNEQTIFASDGKTYINYIASTCMITAFGHLDYPDWDILYRPKETKKLTRCGLPLMFPNFSSCKDDKFLDANTTLPKHGIFCREFYDSKMTWTESERTEHSVTMTATSNDESRKMYPYDFVLKVTFTVLPKKLVHHWEIINCEEAKTLPVSPGLHPYFAIPQPDKTKVSLKGGCDFDCTRYDWENHCPDDNLPFSGEMVIEIPNKGKLLLKDTSSAYKKMQVWSDKSSAPDHEFICFEPVRLGADGINNSKERINVNPKDSVTLECEISIMD